MAEVDRMLGFVGEEAKRRLAEYSVSNDDFSEATDYYLRDLSDDEREEFRDSLRRAIEKGIEKSMFVFNSHTVSKEVEAFNAGVCAGHDWAMEHMTTQPDTNQREGER